MIYVMITHSNYMNIFNQEFISKLQFYGI